MAVFNLDYYVTKDSYSDGDIELIISDIVNGKSRMEDYYGEYAVFYHLSPIRENIVNWYPFKKDGCCLEIGAGCGAVTGALCRKLRKVVSVDISKRRSEINYNRHKDIENLEIIVGNFHDVSFEEKFDYIILNGVFEYAMSFTHTEQNPYAEFLSSIRPYLKDDGRILIAIENRLGAKYFAGAPEDHTESYFLGLNEYEGNDTVRTFSKIELTELMKACGFEYLKFYYPYPDYKLPMEIFTDKSMEEFHYGRSYLNHNRNTCNLFDEQKFTYALVKEGVADRFANSFFLEACLTDDNTDVLYAKMNSDRKEEFRIVTRIDEINGERKVYKFPANEKAREHIQHTGVNAQVVYGDGIVNASAHEYGDGISYPFYEYETLDGLIEKAARQKNQKEVIRLLKDFFDPIIASGQKADYQTEEFAKVFGLRKTDRDLLCMRPGNIDLICDNIMVKDKEYLLIDPEWVFDMDVPVLYCIWRSIQELCEKHGNLQDILDCHCLNAEFGIDRELSEVFLDWTLFFLEHYVGNGMEAAFAVPKKRANLVEQIGNVSEVITSTLYMDIGDGFSEESKLIQKVSIENSFFKVRYSLPEGVKALRWDPVEQRICRCRITKVNGNFEGIGCHEENGFSVFDTLDPQYIIKDFDKELEIEGQMEFLSLEEAFLKCVKRNQELEARLAKTPKELLKRKLGRNE